MPQLWSLSGGSSTANTVGRVHSYTLVCISEWLMPVFDFYGDFPAKFQN